MNRRMKSPIKWVGGKSRMVKKLLPMIPEHKCYVEVFGGAGHLLFGKEESKVEILNDLDGELMNFWSVVKNAPEEFINSFEFELVSRQNFDEYKRRLKAGEIHDCIERAHVFYYLVQAGFGAEMKSPCFGTSKESRNGLRIEQIADDIRQAYNRLKKVTIENKDFSGLFKIYDGPNTFYFLDSPYRKTADYAVGRFTDNDYQKLYECCRDSKGKWLYTINDDPFIRDLFKDFNIRKHEVAYSISKNQSGRKRYGELIITNYEVSA